LSLLAGLGIVRNRRLLHSLDVAHDSGIAAHVAPARKALRMTLPRRFSSNQFLANLISYADRKAERAAQRLRDKEIDPELAAAAKELERLAIGQSELFPLEKRKRAAFQLRLPGI
jgi:hypothetical protein